MKPKHWTYLWHAAVLVGLVAAAIQYLSGAEIARAFIFFDWQYAPLILLLATCYMLLKAWRFTLYVHANDRSNGWTIVRGYSAAQAATLVPGGIAARVGILKQAGIDAEDSAAAVVLSSASDQAVLMSGALICGLWFDAARKPLVYLLSGLIVISLVLGLESIRTPLVRFFRGTLDRVNLLRFWQSFLRSVARALHWKLVWGGLAITVASFILLTFALEFSARGVGVDLPYLVLALAITLPAALGRISAMPGGFGVTEAGMVGVINAAPGVSLGQAAAIVAAYRVGTVLFTALLGAMIYFFAWRGPKERTE